MELDAGGSRDPELRAVEALAEQPPPRDTSRRDAFRIVAVYFVLGAAWFSVVHMTPAIRAAIGLDAGIAFLLVSSVAGYFIGRRYLDRLYVSQMRYAEAQRSLRQRDIAIRQAYVDVLAAVTGGKLILMAVEEVEGVLGRPVSAPARIRDDADVAAARHTLDEALGPLTGRSGDIELAVSEALTNVRKHAGEGEYWIARTDGCIQAVVRDSGPGIDFQTLPRAALIPGFSTKQSLGMGFTIMLNLSDRLLLASDPGGTILVLEFDLTRSPGQEDAGASVQAVRPDLQTPVAP